jgi:hypothetical protein
MTKQRSWTKLEIKKNDYVIKDFVVLPSVRLLIRKDEL